MRAGGRSAHLLGEAGGASPQSCVVLAAGGRADGQRSVLGEPARSLPSRLTSAGGGPAPPPAPVVACGLRAGSGPPPTPGTQARAQPAPFGALRGVQCGLWLRGGRTGAGAARVRRLPARVPSGLPPAISPVTQGVDEGEGLLASPSRRRVACDAPLNPLRASFSSSARLLCCLRGHSHTMDTQNWAHCRAAGGL